MVIAEIVWTLESFYKIPKLDIQKQVLAIINTPGLVVDNDNQIIQAILWYEELNIDYIDAYNAAWMFENDIQSICTFDRKHFHRLEGINTIVPGE